jgi:hypothetical protein
MRCQALLLTRRQDELRERRQLLHHAVYPALQMLRMLPAESHSLQEQREGHGREATL